MDRTFSRFLKATFHLVIRCFSYHGAYIEVNRSGNKKTIWAIKNLHPRGKSSGRALFSGLSPKVVSPVGAKQPAALHRWGVRTPTGADLPRLWGKKNPRCASVELGCATWLLGDGTRPMWLRPGPVGDGTRPMKVTDRPRAKVPPVQARKPAFGGFLGRGQLASS